MRDAFEKIKVSYHFSNGTIFIVVAINENNINFNLWILVEATDEKGAWYEWATKFHEIFKSNYAFISIDC